MQVILQSKKKNFPPVSILLSVSVSKLFLLELSDKETAQGTGLSSLQRLQKDLDAQVGGLKTLHWLPPRLLPAHLRASTSKTLQAKKEKEGKEKERT